MPIIISGSNGISGADGTAALPAVQGTDGNTGMFFPGADRIGFAEGGVQVGEFDASGNFLFNSGYGSVATAFGCRAWVNFNGTGTVAIRASGNVSSITDNGVGIYTVNFTNSMPDINYCVSGCAGDPAFVTVACAIYPRTLAVGSAQIYSYSLSAVALTDVGNLNLAIFR
jgi:hypothetical protein